VLPYMNADPRTHGIVIIGEIGGSEEEEFAAALNASRCTKPVYALIAGRTAREGIAMGHAGALIQGGTGTIESKTEALVGAGVQVFRKIQDLVEAVFNEMGSAAGEIACG
jgi:succinyl-CoA synthetase alpha subunit